MNLSNASRTRLSKIPGLNKAIDFICARANTVFGAEHNNESGAHAAITADSLMLGGLGRLAMDADTLKLTINGVSAVLGRGLSLVGYAEGTNATAAATNVATFPISGLTAKDHLRVVLRHSSTTQQTAVPELSNATDSVTMLAPLCAGGLIAPGDFVTATVDIYPDQQALAYVFSEALVSAPTTLGASSTTGTVTCTGATFTTPWTSSWNLALRTGAGGVTAGGTYHYKIAVFKVQGQ